MKQQHDVMKTLKWTRKLSTAVKWNNENSPLVLEIRDGEAI